MDNRHEPATKADIAALTTDVAALKAATKADIAAVNERIDMLRSEFQHGFDDLKETLRDSQTELLKAFYNYAESNNERVTSTEADAASLKKRLGIVEGRLTDVERRLNTPPVQ